MPSNPDPATLMALADRLSRYARINDNDADDDSEPPEVTWGELKQQSELMAAAADALRACADAQQRPAAPAPEGLDSVSARNAGIPNLWRLIDRLSIRTGCETDFNREADLAKRELLTLFIRGMALRACADAQER
jgi:hypothetical protein